jgi:hypothetical protein
MKPLTIEEMISLRGGGNGGPDNLVNEVYAPVVNINSTPPSGNSTVVQKGATVVLPGGTGSLQDSPQQPPAWIDLPFERAV